MLVSSPPNESPNEKVELLSSLAGRVQRPRLPEGPVRIGGFGGADGLTEFLRAGRYDAIVDATHPFAATISANAALAAARTGIARLVLCRAGWETDPSWELVADMPAAAQTVRDWVGESVFVTTGRRDLEVFADDDRHSFLVRTVDPPSGRVPARMTLLLDRGPYTLAGESTLLREHGIGLLVTKNSGGSLTVAKLHAAAACGVRVVMVARPALPAGSLVVESAEAAWEWIEQALPTRQ